MAKLLSRDDILATPGVGRELVDVPEWGGAVYVRGLTVRERNQYVEACHEAGRRRPDWMEQLVARCVCKDDTSREPMFTPADADAISEKSPAVLDRLFKAAARLSGLEIDPEEAAKN